MLLECFLCLTLALSTALAAPTPVTPDFCSSSLPAPGFEADDRHLRTGKNVLKFKCISGHRTTLVDYRKYKTMKFLPFFMKYTCDGATKQWTNTFPMLRNTNRAIICTDYNTDCFTESQWTGIEVTQFGLGVRAVKCLLGNNAENIIYCQRGQMVGRIPDCARRREREQTTTATTTTTTTTTQQENLYETTSQIVSATEASKIATRRINQTLTRKNQLKFNVLQSNKITENKSYEKRLIIISVVCVVLGLVIILSTICVVKYRHKSQDTEITADKKPENKLPIHTTARQTSTSSTRPCLNSQSSGEDNQLEINRQRNSDSKSSDGSSVFEP